MKLVIAIVVLCIVMGRFFYSVYASEYHYEINYKTDKIIQKNSISIATYNIKSLNYKKENLDLFNQDIQNLDLDVICLQEVDKNALRSGHFDMLKQIAHDNNYQYYHFYSTMWILNGYYGLGILSRYPIIEVSSHLLPNSLIKEPRILTKTTILMNNKKIAIYNTHLTYENNDIRISQMNYLRKHIDFSNHTILAGDFNSFAKNGDFTIDNVSSINHQKQYITFRHYGSPDNIFYSHDFSVKEKGVQISSFSDHHLLYAKFKLTNN